jgi:hypothetical protein
MEISPITGIRAMPVMKSPPADPELTALFDIENSAAKSARGSEDDGSEDEFDDLADEDEVESTRQPVGKNPSRQISFFA